MFAIINITTDKRRGFFTGILQYFFPSVIKSIIEDVPVYDVKVPMYSRRGAISCRKKLVSELKNDGIDRFLCDGGWREILEEEGFSYIRYKPYLMNNLFSAAESLSIKGSEYSSEFNVILHDVKESIKTKELFVGLSTIFRNVTLITNDIDAYTDVQNEIFEATGAATIITDSYVAVNDAQLIISLSKTEKLFSKGKIKSCTIIIAADSDFLPTAYLGVSVINAFSPALTQNQMRLCRGSIAPWELAAALDMEYMPKNREITEFYSFGRSITADSLISDAIRKFRIVNENKAYDINE